MISARINRACRSNGRANVHALLAGVNYSETREDDGRRSSYLASLSSRSRTRGYDLGKLHIFLFFPALFFLFFPFFFLFYISALSGPCCLITAAGDVSLFSSYRVVSASRCASAIAIRRFI